MPHIQKALVKAVTLEITSQEIKFIYKGKPRESVWFHNGRISTEKQSIKSKELTHDRMIHRLCGLPFILRPDELFFPLTPEDVCYSNFCMPEPSRSNMDKDHSQVFSGVLALPSRVLLKSSGKFRSPYLRGQLFRTLDACLRSLPQTTDPHPLEEAILSEDYVSALQIMHERIIRAFKKPQKRQPVTQEHQLPPYVYKHYKRYRAVAPITSSYLGLFPTSEEAFQAIVDHLEKNNIPLPSRVQEWKANMNLPPIKIPEKIVYHFNQTDYKTHEEAMQAALEYYKDLKPELSRQIEEYLEKHY